MTKLPNKTFLVADKGGYRHLDRDGKTTLAWYPTFPKNLKFRKL